MDVDRKIKKKNIILPNYSKTFLIIFLSAFATKANERTKVSNESKIAPIETSYAFKPAKEYFCNKINMTAFIFKGRFNTKMQLPEQR